MHVGLLAAVHPTVRQSRRLRCTGVRRTLALIFAGLWAWAVEASARVSVAARDRLVRAGIAAGHDCPRRTRRPVPAHASTTPISWDGPTAAGTTVGIWSWPPSAPEVRSAHCG